MTVLRLILSAVIGYALGSLSSAVIVSYIVSRKDIRNYGSHNAGATNMARLFGMGAGVATLLLDGLKTAAAMALGRLIGGEEGFLLAGAACLFGHCFPIYFRFKGGKGVVVGATIGLMLDWRLLALLVAVFFLTFALTRRVSAGSIMCAVAFTPLELLLGIRGIWTTVMGVVCGALVFFMHRRNLARLLNGTEKKFRPRRLRGRKRR